MSDIFPDRNIVEEINSNRGSSAEQKIQFRIMQALESIAESLHEYMRPSVPQPSEPAPIPYVLRPESQSDGAGYRDSLSTTSEAVPIVEEDRGRRRRRQESA